MKEIPGAYLPRDRLMALIAGTDLPSDAEGSVLFADISGFTPLTEAYEAHMGARRGGEELTRILNEVYALLIGQVEACRGSVIGFAGDAITCWFDADKGNRAVSCGLAMQGIMERFQSIPSPGGGSMALGLKAAVTTGSVKRFVVGRPEIQLVDVLAGEPVYQVAQVEQLAERGEVLVDRRTQEQLGERLKIKEERRSGEVQAWVVEGIVGGEASLPWPALAEVLPPVHVLEPWLISAIRERLQSGHADFLTELRPATALFLKFEGIDFEEDSQAAAKLDGFFSAVQAIVAEYEGVVHQLTVGDKGSFLYAAFGAPISHEDDTIRAVAVSLRLQQVGRSMGFLGGLRIGLGRGTTRTGAYGGPTRRTYGVLGDQVNLAARLMGKAAPGQILLSEAVAREVEEAFVLRQLDKVKVKGKSHPVTVFEVAAQSERPQPHRRAGGYALPLIGRQRELQELEKVLTAAAEGRGQSVSLLADAGIGKTRVAAEAVERARQRGFRIFRGDCQTFGSNTLYTPWWGIWRDFFSLKGPETAEEVELALRERLQAINPRLRPRIPLLAPVLNLDIPDNDLTLTFDAKLRRVSLESLLVECLRAESLEQPVLIVLEDGQAMDAVSRDLLRVLIQAAARIRVAFVIVQRPLASGTLLSPAELSLDYVHQISLEELGKAESEELIRQKFAQLQGNRATLAPAVMERLVERTGGNPFFIEEVMNWLHHRRIDFTSIRALDAQDLPVSLYALVLSRMDQLEETTRVTLKVASVVGRLFRAAVIWGAYPDIGQAHSVCQSLDLLSQREFMEREPGDAELTYLFKHVVIHEVAYESLPMRLREQIHESIGAYVEREAPTLSTEVLDLLAFHYGRSAHVEKKRKYLLMAADAARLAYANSAAADYYGAVLDLLDPGEKIPVLQNRGHVLEVMGDWKQAMEDYEAALALAGAAGDAAQTANCQLMIGDLLRKSGRFAEAVEALRAARLAFKERGDQSGMGQVLHSEGTLAAQTGDYDRAKQLYARSMELRQILGEEAKVASLMSNIGILERFQGNLDKALRLQEDSLLLRQRLNDRWAIGNSLNNLGMAKRYTGDLAGARQHLEEALRILKKVGDRAEIANTLNSLAEVALDQQDSVAGETYLQESLSLTRELGNLRALAFLFEAFAANAFFQKRPVRCLRLFGAARVLRERIGAPLPDADKARIEETIDLASQSARGLDAARELQVGAEMALSAALDFAEGRNE